MYIHLLIPLQHYLISNLPWNLTFFSTVMINYKYAYLISQVLILILEIASTTSLLKFGIVINEYLPKYSPIKQNPHTMMTALLEDNYN